MHEFAGALELVERPAQRGEFLLVLGLVNLGDFEQLLDFLQLAEDLAQCSDDLVGVGKGLADRFAVPNGARFGFWDGCGQGRGRRFGWRAGR